MMQIQIDILGDRAITPNRSVCRLTYKSDDIKINNLEVIGYLEYKPTWYIGNTFKIVNKQDKWCVVAFQQFMFKTVSLDILANYSNINENIIDCEYFKLYKMYKDTYTPPFNTASLIKINNYKAIQAK